MNAATEHLIEAMKATKRGDDREEAHKLHDAFLSSVETDNGCALDLPVILEALMEIVVGERCIAVPVREVERMLSARNEVVYHPENVALEEFRLAADAILARLPKPKPNHVDVLKVLRNDYAKRFDDEGVVAALESAIKRMEQP